jgi:hypothetical protein
MNQPINKSDLPYFCEKIVSGAIFLASTTFTRLYPYLNKNHNRNKPFKIYEMTITDDCIITVARVQLSSGRGDKISNKYKTRPAPKMRNTQKKSDEVK